MMPTPPTPNTHTSHRSLQTQILRFGSPSPLPNIHPTLCCPLTCAPFGPCCTRSLLSPSSSVLARRFPHHYRLKLSTCCCACFLARAHCFHPCCTYLLHISALLPFFLYCYPSLCTDYALIALISLLLHCYHFFCTTISLSALILLLLH